jgi:trimeric autotransporter adhesin
MSHSRTRLLLTLCLAGAAAGQAHAQCQPGWSSMDCGLNGLIYSMIVWDDDGNGPHPAQLYAGGTFTQAGDMLAAKVAKWNGQDWEPLGEGLNGAVNALTVFDDDGNGPHAAALYAGGAFTKSGNTPAANIAKWTGSAWVALGAGVDDEVTAMGVFDPPGAAPAGLYAGGRFLKSGNTPMARIARWDGSAWTGLGAGVDGRVRSLLGADPDGNGPMTVTLFVGGEFHNAGGQPHDYFATWDGAAWSGPAAEPNHYVTAMTIWDADGAGPNLPALCLGGLFGQIGNTPLLRLARWDGTNFAAIGGGLNATQVYGLKTFDADGTGPGIPALVVGGFITKAGNTTVSNIARWDGANWSDLGGGTDTTVFAIAARSVAGGGLEPALYAGGYFKNAGGTPVVNIARYGCMDSVEACAAELTGDCALDLFDFLAFVNLFNDGADRADFTGDGVLDLFDFLGYVNTFNTGC